MLAMWLKVLFTAKIFDVIVFLLDLYPESRTLAIDCCSMLLSKRLGFIVKINSQR